MNWPSTLSSLSEHWKWLPAPSLLLGFAGWIGRRKGFQPRAWVVRRIRVERALWTCEENNKDLRRDLADCQQSIEGGRKAIDYAAYALREIASAAEQVKAVEETMATAHSTSSTDLRSGRSRSRRNSVASRSTRKRGPLEIP